MSTGSFRVLSSKTARLALSLAVIGLLMPSASAQMVGPQAPNPENSVPSGSMNETFGKLFKKLKGETTGESSEQTDGETAAPARPAVATPPTAAPAPVKRPPMLSQPALTNVQIEPAQISPDNPPLTERPRLDDPKNNLGIRHAENQFKLALDLIEKKRHSEARPILQNLRPWLVDATEAHINLYKTLNAVPSAQAQAELEKQLALEFAQLRDWTMYELGKVHIAENNHQKAVKELVDVIRSQPRSKVGLHAYEMLQEIGFTEKLHLAQ